jgi:hypothetical protein
MIRRRATARRVDERGAILILALIMLVATSAVVLALASWTTANLSSTAAFQSTGARLYAADAATQIAMRASRYTYPANTTLAGYQCPGTPTPLIPVNGLYVEDWCITTSNVSPTITRQVVIVACQVPTATSTLGGPCQVGGVSEPTLLIATVNFDDNNGQNPAIPNCTSVTNQSTCGTEMSIVSWQVV